MKPDIRLIPLVGGAEIRIKFYCYKDAKRYEEWLNLSQSLGML